eukprot:10830719-Prorocentrum_lima.AAC.1
MGWENYSNHEKWMKFVKCISEEIRIATSLKTSSLRLIDEVHRLTCFACCISRTILRHTLRN